jgi:hypothetical protein
MSGDLLGAIWCFEQPRSVANATNTFIVMDASAGSSTIAYVLCATKYPTRAPVRRRRRGGRPRAERYCANQQAFAEAKVSAFVSGDMSDDVCKVNTSFLLAFVKRLSSTSYKSQTKLFLCQQLETCTAVI